MPPDDQAAARHRRTFLLSLWREHEGGPWRATLQPGDGGARLGFADPEQLAAYLLRRYDEALPPDAAGLSAPHES